MFLHFLSYFSSSELFFLFFIKITTAFPWQAPRTSVPLNMSGRNVAKEDYSYSSNLLRPTYGGRAGWRGPELLAAEIRNP